MWMAELAQPDPQTVGQVMRNKSCNSSSNLVNSALLTLMLEAVYATKTRQQQQQEAVRCRIKLK
jgi:hypothetical protein